MTLATTISNSRDYDDEPKTPALLKCKDGHTSVIDPSNNANLCACPLNKLVCVGGTGVLTITSKPELGAHCHYPVACEQCTCISHERALANCIDVAVTGVVFTYADSTQKPASCSDLKDNGNCGTVVSGTIDIDALCPRTCNACKTTTSTTAATTTTTMAPACVDTPGWENGQTSECSDYLTIGWCKGGGALPDKEWTLGSLFKFPERNCCVCGKATYKPAPATTAAATVTTTTTHTMTTTATTATITITITPASTSTPTPAATATATRPTTRTCLAVRPFFKACPTDGHVFDVTGQCNEQTTPFVAVNGELYCTEKHCCRPPQPSPKPTLLRTAAPTASASRAAAVSSSALSVPTSPPTPPGDSSTSYGNLSTRLVNVSSISGSSTAENVKNSSPVSESGTEQPAAGTTQPGPPKVGGSSTALRTAPTGTTAAQEPGGDEITTALPAVPATDPGAGPTPAATALAGGRTALGTTATAASPAADGAAAGGSDGSTPLAAIVVPVVLVVVCLLAGAVFMYQRRKKTGMPLRVTALPHHSTRRLLCVPFATAARAPGLCPHSLPVAGDQLPLAARTNWP